MTSSRTYTRDNFTAYEVKVMRGPYKGKIARVVGFADAGTISRVREVTCKFADGTYKMVPEEWTERVGGSK